MCEMTIVNCTSQYIWLTLLSVGSHCRFNLNVQNGKVYYLQESSYQPVMAFFHCNNGYELYGKSAVVCKDSQWSMQAPDCRGINTTDVHVTDYSCHNMT